ncbi:MAG TPA: hypothetical protein VK599_12265 [Streptosporangiaceae bacterium]|nr:hypothetical protein [Streptosporangiaceae bacterium]
MTSLGYAPTETMTSIPVTRPAVAPVTAAAFALPGTVRPGTLVTYAGSSAKDHGFWILEGPCPCGCGGLKLWRQERDGLHGLVHVSARSVAGQVWP